LSRRSGSSTAALVRDSAVEFVLLVGLWMLFVSTLSRAEFVAGLVAAAIASFADAVLKSQGFAKFRPRATWLLLATWEVWYSLSGTWAIMVALAKRVAGKKSEAQFRAVKFDAGGDDGESWARRALVTMYTTIPPNFVVIGIDRDHDLMLVHQVSPTGTPEIAKRLGAQA